MPRLAPLAFAVLFACSAVYAGDAAPRFDPVRPPLAAVRVPRPGTVPALADSRLVESAGAAGRDWSVNIPGLFRMPGVVVFFEKLADAGATDFWFCLVELNRSAMGWRMPAADGGDSDPQTIAEAFLAGLGLNAARSLVTAEERGDGTVLVTVATDRKAFAALFPAERGTAPDAAWRKNLRNFIHDSSDGVGVWADPRPLSGIAAMATSVDARTFFSGAGLELPSALSLWLVPNDTTIGLRLRLEGLFRDPPRGETTVGGGDATAFFPAFSQPLAVRLEADLAGLPALSAKASPGGNRRADRRFLIPETAALGIWTDRERERLCWSVAGLCREGFAAMRRLRRFQPWLSLLTGDADHGLSVAVAADTPTLFAYGLEAGGEQVLLGAGKSESGREIVFFTNAGLAGLPETIVKPTYPEGGKAAAAWEILLNTDERAELIRALERSRALPRRVMPDFLETWIGDGEKGRLMIEDGGVTLDSPRGALLWFIPGAAAILRSQLEALFPDVADLAAARLRFLLSASSRLRFREAGPDRPVPEGLPSGLEQLAFSDAAGSAWLDNALGPFPGTGKPNAPAVLRLAAGGAVDGYSYRIETGPGGWFIVAEPASDAQPALRTDADGFMTELPPGGSWRPRQASFGEWLASF